MLRALSLSLLILLLPAATAAAQEPTPLPAAPGAEAEPNDSAATATPIADGERIRARRAPGDTDLYSFSATAGDRVFATVMTANSVTSRTNSRLALLASDGETALESDDDDGQLGVDSSSLAGVAIPATGTYYLRVDSPNDQDLRPYDLVLEVHTGAPAAEAEPNGHDQPQALGAERLVAGTMTAGDVDIYTLELGAGDTVFASLDLDPGRDGTPFNGLLAFGRPPQLLAVDDSGASDPTPSEAIVGSVGTSGTYRVGITSTAGREGDYLLSITIIPAVERGCRTYTIEPAEGAIPDTGAATFEIDVPDEATIDHMAVRVDITHAFMSDLDATLAAPAGNRIALFDDIGSSRVGENTRMRLTFDENAGLPPLYQVVDELAVQPERSTRLGYFDGQQAAGTWTLTLRDDATGDVGTLARFELVLCARPDEGPTDTVFSAGFEDGEDGFTHSGAADEWERGTPATPETRDSAALATCGEGTGCFKTDLDGTYDAGSSQDLVSPPISLAGRSGPIYASWRMWHQLENASFDRLAVTVEEDGGANPRPLFTWDGFDMVTDHGRPALRIHVTAGWGRHRADVSEYAGKTIRLRFHVDADSTVQRAGVAIDDVRVYVPAHDLDVEIGGSGGGYVDSAPAGIDCGTGRPACSITSSGEVVLTAHPDADSSFAGFTGCDAAGMTCAVTLDQARSVTATFDLLPHAPLAIADAYTADEELPRVVDAPGVLVNDSDRNDDPLTAELVTGPAHGTLELRPDGSFTYVSERDYHGLDSFTYRASDGDLESEPATVTLGVGPIEDAVDAQDDAFVTAEDTALRVDAPGLLGNDRDPDGDPLTAALESEPEHGSVELSPDGSFVYTPDPDFSGSDSFVYRASDSQPATVTIAVAPVDDAPAPGGVLPATASDVAAISDLELGSRCVRRNAAGRVRVPMSMTLSQPGTVRVRVDRAVGSRGRSSCPRANPVRNQRFRRVATFRPVARVRAASVPREVMLDLRLRPGLYRLTVRVLLEDGRVSPPARRFLRVVG